ncbi:MAG TPA: hypothetical protein G4O04_03705 [Anaerolineae bacterium]|nr:hypothetical protein [Anaerolineae bacterium]
MELELEFQGNAKAILWTLVLFLVLVGLGAYGRVVTPNPPKVLTWADWRFRAVQRQYTRQLAAMRRDAEALAALLDSRPNLRTAWQAEQIAARWQRAEVLDALTGRREALVQAAQAVQDWVAGRREEEQVREVLQHALEGLSGE